MQQRFRLRRGEDFARLRRNGRVQRHPMLTLSLTPNGLPHNRYGFITSKQVGNAVVRNRVRRLLREVVRQLHPQLQSGHDIAIIARQHVVGQPLTTLLRIVEELSRRAGIFREYNNQHENTRAGDDTVL